MEINDIIKLMQAVSKNGLTSFQWKENDTTLTIEKKEGRGQRLEAFTGNSAAFPMVRQTAMAGMTAGSWVLNDGAGDPSPAGMGGQLPVGGQFAGGQLQGSQFAAGQLQGGQFAAGQLPGALAAAGQVEAEGTIDSDKIVVSPLVGTFYHSSSPEAEPYVKVGDSVKKGQTLGIIEAMKLMNEIECEFDGVVDGILVGNEDVVEYGQPLFRIR